MSEKHLYGTDYAEYDPPREWGGVAIDLNINTDAYEASTDNNELTFVGDIAKYVLHTYIPAYGVNQGLHYRVDVTESGETETCFDGFIDISRATWLSIKEPIIFSAPIVEKKNNATLFDKISVLTVTLLKSEGFLKESDFIDIPVIYESKKNLGERTLILVQLINQIVTYLLSALQQLYSAVSDILGVSIAVGIVELASFIIGLSANITLIQNSLEQHKDLFFPLKQYYRAASIATYLKRAAEKEGLGIDFGELTDVLEKSYLLPSQNGDSGTSVAGTILINGLLKTTDHGYILGELLQTVQETFNTRQDVRDGVLHIKNKFDPYWSSSVEFEPENVLLQTTDQYSNGTTSYDTESLKALWVGNYAFDDSDTHTLTEKNGDSYEVKRKLISVLDEGTITLRGVDRVEIPYAMAVRKKVFDNLSDIFGEAYNQFNFYFSKIQDTLNTYLDQINAVPLEGDVSDALSTILTSVGADLVLTDRSGSVKIDDNAFSTPKLCYMEKQGIEFKLPANFKDFVGMPAIYNNWHFKDSPADVNGFKGQRQLLNNWRIRFYLKNYNQVKSNPWFYYEGFLSNITSLKWLKDKGEATINAEVYRPFDTNITEEAS